MRQACMTGVALVAFAAMAASPGRAQVAPTGGALEEVIVTAEKRSENLQQTPMAISAVGAATIEARNITSIANLSSIAPSLNVNGASAGPSTGTLFIRGLGSQDPLLTVDSPVGLYVDGIIVGRAAGSAFDIADLDRVEVLRGPQGTLYGRNTLGGAVNLVTRKPTATAALKEKLSYGAFDAMESRTRVDTGDLGSSGLRAALSFLHKQRDGYVDDLTAPDSRDPGAYRTDAARAALAYDQGAGLRGDYSFSYNRNKATPNAVQMSAVRPDIAAAFAGSAAAGGTPLLVSQSRIDPLYTNNSARITDKVQAHSLVLEADLAGATLRSLTGYRKWTQAVPDSDLDGQGTLLGRVSGQGTALLPVTLFSATAQRRQHQWSQELNLLGTVAGKFDYVVGGYYFKEHAFESNPQSFAAILATGALPRASVLSYTHESATKALFGQGTAHFSDRLSLTGGMRYTWDQKHLVQTSPLVRDLNRDYGKFNWAATVDYTVTDDVLSYVRVASGDKAGGFNARSADAGFSPERLISYEAGMKSELFDRRLRLNAAAFHANHKDVQVTQFQAGTNGATSITTNASSARYNGVEAEVTALPVTGLSTYASIGYVHRTYKRFIALDPATNQLVDIAANGTARFANSPSTTVNIGAEYTFPSLGFGVVKARLDYSYRSKIGFNPSPYGAPFRDAIVAGGRGLLDARLTLADLQIGGADASVSLWGRNITDKEYRLVGIDFGGLGFATNVYGEPASWGIDLTISF